MLSGNKITTMILSAVLVLMTTIIIGSFNYIMDDIKETMADQKEDLAKQSVLMKEGFDKQTVAIEALTRATNDGLLDRELTKKDVAQVRKDLDKLIERNDP